MRDVETGVDLPDHLKWIKFSGASWSYDNHGFFYSRYDEPNEATKLEDVNYFQKLFYHQLGKPQSEDMLIYERADQKEWGFNGGVTEDGRYLIISVWQGTAPKLDFIHLLEAFAQATSRISDLLSDFLNVGYSSDMRKSSRV